MMSNCLSSNSWNVCVDFVVPTHWNKNTETISEVRSSKGQIQLPPSIGKVTVKVMMIQRTYRLMWTLGHMGGPVILHNPKVSLLIDMKVAVCMQKTLYMDLTT
jgi:hypothetical protein